jgi:hypothetical protein
MSRCYTYKHECHSKGNHPPPASFRRSQRFLNLSLPMSVATVHTIESSHVTHADSRCPGVTTDVYITCGSKGNVQQVITEILQPLRSTGLVPHYWNVFEQTHINIQTLNQILLIHTVYKQSYRTYRNSRGLHLLVTVMTNTLEGHKYEYVDIYGLSATMTM